jgi:hypothetical protein
MHMTTISNVDSTYVFPIYGQSMIFSIWHFGSAVVSTFDCLV